jgi:uncharacterized membrane protein (UPF0127 family)
MVMDGTKWFTEMAKLQSSFAFLNTCNVIDITFANGEVWEVYVAASKEQRQRGLSEVSSLDLDGMLFCYDQPSFMPFHMKNMAMDLNMGWYDQSGQLVASKWVAANHDLPLYCHVPFSYVLESPHVIPPTNLVVSNG